MEGLSRLFRNLQDAFAMYSYQIVPTTSTPSDDPASTLVGDEELPFAKYKDDLSASLSLPLGISFLNFETPVPRSLYLISTSSLKTCLQFLIPSFTNSVWKEAHPKPTKISPTAYLNGVRGLAAFFVWNRHFLNDYYRGEPNWGYLSRPQDVWVAQLLIVRLIYAGSFMITIFFVLSSFVLSYKPLRYVRAGEYEKLVKSLSSSVFRRGLRLFLPVVPPLIFAALCVHCGLYSVEQHPMEWTFLVIWGRQLSNSTSCSTSRIWMISVRYLYLLCGPYPMNSEAQ